MVVIIHIAIYQIKHFVHLKIYDVIHKSYLKKKVINALAVIYILGFSIHVCLCVKEKFDSQAMQLM